jgi:hypothetical protein
MDRWCVSVRDKALAAAGFVDGTDCDAHIEFDDAL